MGVISISMCVIVLPVCGVRVSAVLSVATLKCERHRQNFCNSVSRHSLQMFQESRIRVDVLELNCHPFFLFLLISPSAHMLLRGVLRVGSVHGDTRGIVWF